MLSRGNCARTSTTTAVCQAHGVIKKRQDLPSWKKTSCLAVARLLTNFVTTLKRFECILEDAYVRRRYLCESCAALILGRSENSLLFENPFNRATVSGRTGVLKAFLVLKLKCSGP